MSNKHLKVYIAGHRGLVGGAIQRELISLGYSNIITRTHDELDLQDSIATLNFFEQERPDLVFLAAAKVGGIYANNKYPVDFLMNNLLIEANVFNSSYKTRVQRLIFLGSSCIYPRECNQPIKEEYLLNGPLEDTNRPYALAKIAGVEMCWAYNRQYNTKWLATMPTNLFGPGDNYDPNYSHVLPALIRKIHEAKLYGKNDVVLWGTGAPRREFLYVDDLANALVHLAMLDDQRYDQLIDPARCPVINIGTGQDLTIKELAEVIAQVIGYKGKFSQDISKPDGTLRKVLDISRILNLGWTPKVNLIKGIELTYDSFLSGSFC